MVWYCTREAVKSALDSKETARNNPAVDRAIASGARAIEALTHRTFAPELDTRYFPWPSTAYRSSWRLWLDQHELVSVTSLASGGTTISSADYFLEPSDGPPYTHIEIDRASSATFATGDTWQRNIAITGLFGYDLVEESVGTLTSNLDADITDTAAISWTVADVGVGDVLKIDDERMIVESKSFGDSTQDLQTPLTASMANETVAVSSGAAFAAGEVIKLDAERMLVVDIAANNLTVKRAWDGSTLAAHTASDIYSLSVAGVARAALGTTLAAHTTNDVVYRHVFPPAVRDLNIAEAIHQLANEGGGYTRTVGSGDATRPEPFGRGLDLMRRQVYAKYGPKPGCGSSDDRSAGVRPRARVRRPRRDSHGRLPPRGEPGGGRRRRVDDPQPALRCPSASDRRIPGRHSHRTPRAGLAAPGRPRPEGAVAGGRVPTQLIHPL